MTAGPLSWAPDLDEDDELPAGLPAVATGTRRSGGFLRELPLLLGFALLVAIVVRTFVFQAFYIPSASMGCAGCPVHTLEINDRIIVSKLSYRFHEPRRGDIVVFECPDSPAVTCAERGDAANPVFGAIRFVAQTVGVFPPSTEDYVKRVVGLPNEVIEIEAGLVWVNGRPLDEPYLPPGTVTEPLSLTEPYRVPPGSILVLGDNRANSSDGRRFEAIPIDSVVGRTVVRFWPPDRIGFL